MKILVFPFGSAGDVHPMVGLALALKARGHDVTVAVCGYFNDLVDRAGLERVEIGTRDDFLAALKHPDLWSPTRSFGHIFRTGIAQAMRPQYDLIAQRLPDVVVNSALGFGARIAHDALGVPLVTVHLQPGVIWSAYESPRLPGMVGPWAPHWLKRLQYWAGERFVIDATACPELNRFRKELDLPPVRRVTRWWHSPFHNLGLFPAWYAAPQPDWPKPTTLTSFPLWDESAVAAPRPELEAFLAKGGPPIVFAPGSANSQAAPFFRAAVDACVRLKRRGLLLTKFADQLPADRPDTVAALDYIPFSQVLPRSAALVHHGGIGTAAQALAAGIPQLVMPLAHDQPDNAARLKKLGVGEALIPKRFTGVAAAAALDRLLGSDDVRRCCAEVRDRLKDVKPFDAECDVVVGR